CARSNSYYFDYW
nr:immunoglobulin heavy chain junction region [Mus musculus]